MHRILIGVAALSLFVASPAAAQTRVGIRTGVSGEPGQFVFGGHYETRPLSNHLTFRPNAEIGLGGGVTVVAVNLEFAYWVPIRHHPWSFYAGVGPALVFSEGDDRGAIGGGFNFLFGLQHREGLFTELKVGMIDSPTLKFIVGYAFGRS